MSYFFGFCAVLVMALSPLLRRFYIERFWRRGHGTVVRLDGDVGAKGTWVWIPIVEYEVEGQRYSSGFTYLQRIGAMKSKYSVGDVVEILYSPRNPSRYI